MTGRRLTLLVALLALAMVTATYLQGALSVVAAFLIDEFGVSRSQLGTAFTAFSLTGAFSSPVAGTLADRGTRRVLLGLFGVAVVGWGMIALAPGFGFVLAGSVIAGLGLGAGNPATNRVISRWVEPRLRGLVVGIKQAGPPLGLLGAGLALPPIALAVGWRWALVASILVPLVGAALTLRLVPRDDQEEAGQAKTTDPGAARQAVIWLTVIGTGVATGLSAVLAFVPLYAIEAVGATPAQAGALASAMGVAGVAGRVGWGAVAHRLGRPSNSLLLISALSLAATGLVAVAQFAGVGWLWLGVGLVGASMLAWHSVAWLAIIDRVGLAGLGRASGVMQLGNSIGFGLGPPLAGLVVDHTSSYQWAWWGVFALFAVLTGLTGYVRAAGR
jgi:predicted MFS family arabinose efflux permease